MYLGFRGYDTMASLTTQHLRTVCPTPAHIVLSTPIAASRMNCANGASRSEAVSNVHLNIDIRAHRLPRLSRMSTAGLTRPIPQAGPE